MANVNIIKEPINYQDTDPSYNYSGLYPYTDKTKLNGIASGAEVNQNAFSNVKVGSTTIAADSKTDTLELVAGSNITLTPDATNDTVTIAATGGGSTTLSGLTDTNIDSPSSAEPLTYDSTNSKWVNGGTIPTAYGGTGNSWGYIRTGQLANTTAHKYATIEGSNNTGSGTYAHVEGAYNVASGGYTHVGGLDNTAAYDYQTVIGKHNNNKSSTLFEIGNGANNSSKSNAFEVYSDGKISCDNGTSKFQFTQNNGSDGYYDASGTFHAFGSGSGNTVSKTRYQISSSSWSSSANADGYYTLTATLNPTIGSSPDVYVAGSADGTQPTDTQKTQFSYLKRCKVNGSTLTLYASSKPSSTFYIWVEGVNGTGSGDIVGNVIQPNGDVSGGGINYSTTEQDTGLTWIDGKKIYQKTVDFGALPNNDTKYVECLPNNTRIVDIKAIATYTSNNEHTARLLPFYDVSNNRCVTIYFYTRWFYIATNYDASIYNAYVTLYYTKVS